jgi:hypothetical protein
MSNTFNGFTQVQKRFFKLEFAVRKREENYNENYFQFQTKNKTKKFQKHTLWS